MNTAKKKRIKQYIAWICMVAVVALLAVMPLLAQQEQEQEGPVASILEGTVRLENLETGLQGGGTLTAGSAMDVELPSGVKITEFLVSNGDIVEEGDPVAAVDRVSVMTAITQVRDTLDYIQEEMADARDEKAASTVKATPGGRVKQVFAQPGDDVRDVMLRHGALAVLSLDGMMAVEVHVKTSLAAGDALKVTFSDGSEVSGRVESNLDGVLVVTVNDKNYEVGQMVTVSGDEGVIGAGALYVHNAWKATAFAGTVSTVYARENTDVYSGATLFTLKDTDFTGTLDSLASLHREYEALLQELFAMYESEVITAPCGGQISGVDEKSEFLLSARAGEEGWTLLLLSNQEPGCTGREDCEAETHEPGCAVYCTGLPDCGNLNHRTGCLGVCTGNAATCQSVRSHEFHEKTCLKRCITDLEEDPQTTCDALVHNPGCIETCTGEEDCPALTHKEGCWFHGVTYTAIAARVEVAGTDGLRVIYGTTLYTVTPDASGWVLVEPNELKDVFVGEAEPLLVEKPQDYQTGDIILIVTGTNSSGQTVYQKDALYKKAENENQTPVIPNFPGISDGMGGFGSFSGFGGLTGFGGTAQSTGEELYPLEGSVLMTVTEQDAMTLTITLDEQDIAKVSEGKIAQVKINPLKGRTFEAEITDIGLFGTGNGGSSKFTVELTLPMEEDMIAGMSATAYIPLSTKMDVLTLPVAALVEEGGKTLVYTALDPETGEPASPVEVVTGISDGIHAEILSGLSNGAKYYYKYYDTLELSTDVEKSNFGF